MDEGEKEKKKQAMITALRSLTMGDKSEHDLLEKLRQKGFPPIIIEQTLAQLRGECFLNDAVFAEKLSRKILLGKRAGTHRLNFELKKHHVPDAIRKTVLDTIDPQEQKAQAYELALSKLRSFKDTDRRVLMKKLYDFLVRKGYDFQLAQNAAREALLKSERDNFNENE